MKARIIFAVIVAALLSAYGSLASLTISHRSKPPAWSAPLTMRLAWAADAQLPGNHRLSERDLVLPTQLPSFLRQSLPAKSTVAGRFLARKVARGELITPELLREAPSFDPFAQYLLFAMPVSEPIVTQLRPCDDVLMLDDAAKPVGKVHVAAVVCPSGQCVAMVYGDTNNPTLATMKWRYLVFSHPKAAIPTRAANLASRPPCE